MEVIARKYGPKIVFIKDIHNTIADAITPVSIKQLSQKAFRNRTG
jgi:hypothetical protein